MYRPYFYKKNVHSASLLPQNRLYHDFLTYPHPVSSIAKNRTQSKIEPFLTKDGKPVRQILYIKL